MQSVLRRGHRPNLLTFASPAVFLSRVGCAHGIPLHGVRLTASGEPMTSGRRAALEASGASVQTAYASAETLRIGSGCLAPQTADELHVARQLHALIQAGTPRPGTGLPEKALLVTSLRPTTPLVLINVSLGDQGELIERACGASRERSGTALHLRHITSFEKLTARGMTFLDSDVVRVLEDVLPACFGGAAPDYQLVECATPDGRAQLRLRVHPSLGPLDDGLVRRVFLDALSNQSDAARLTTAMWQQADVLAVERVPPTATPSGKILHLHVDAPP
jgi:hypothetical protein